MIVLEETCEYNIPPEIELALPYKTLGHLCCKTVGWSVIPPTPLRYNKITLQARLRHFYPSNFDREPFPSKWPPSQDASARAGDLWASVILNLNLSKGSPGKAPCQFGLLTHPPNPLCQAATLEQFPPHQKNQNVNLKMEKKSAPHHSGKRVHSHPTKNGQCQELLFRKGVP